MGGFATSGWVVPLYLPSVLPPLERNGDIIVDARKRHV